MHHLQSIESVRERANLVLKQTLTNNLINFDVDVSRLDFVVDYVVQLIGRDYGSDYSSIPPHGRWQHFNVGNVPRVERLVSQWKQLPSDEVARRLLDLFTVSVLLDAGAGPAWKYKANDYEAGRSEGLALASLDMFAGGLFSADEAQPFQVNADRLAHLTVDEMSQGLQVSDTNPLEGLDGRTNLLIRLGREINAHPHLFKTGRPGDLVDYLKSHPSTKASVVQLPTLWNALMEGYSGIWPASRTQLDGQSLGDAWPCKVLAQLNPGSFADSIAPFHKLTQWLCYSLLTPLQKYAGLEFERADLQTGLPEYRNGGLLVDGGVLTLKREADKTKAHPVDSDVIVEWRAATVGLLDVLLARVNAKLHTNLSLPQLLEAGTWKAGRELAAEKRPDRSSPIAIISDGTVF